MNEHDEDRQEKCAQVILQNILINPKICKHIVNNKSLWRTLFKSKERKIFDILYRLCNSLDGKPFLLKYQTTSRPTCKAKSTSFAVFASLSKPNFLPNKVKYFLRRITQICIYWKTKTVHDDGIFNFLKRKLETETICRPFDRPRPNRALAYTPRTVALAMATEYAASKNFLIDHGVLDVCRHLGEIPYYKVFLLHHILQSFSLCFPPKVKSLDITSLFCPCWAKCVATPRDVEAFAFHYKTLFCASCKCNIQHSNRKTKRPHARCDSLSWRERCSNDGSANLVFDQPLADIFYNEKTDMLCFSLRMQFQQPVSLKSITKTDGFFSHVDEKMKFTGTMNFSSTFRMPCVSAKNRKCYNTITSDELNSQTLKCEDCRLGKKIYRQTCIDHLMKESSGRVRPCAGCLIFLSCHHNRNTFLDVREKIRFLKV